jgi:biopolymer transport protein ExbD
MRRVLIAVLVAAAACGRGGEPKKQSAGEKLASQTPLSQVPIDRIAIEPRPKDLDQAAHPGPSDGPVVVMDPGAQAVMSGPLGHRTTHVHQGALNQAWLETELRAAKSDDRSDMEVHAHRGVLYRDAIAAMDIAVKVGLMDVGLADDADVDEKNAASPPPPLPQLGPNALVDAPVVIITHDEVMFQGKNVATVSDVAAGAPVIAALTAVLPKKPSLAILQADQGTDMIVINRVVTTLKHAGFDNVMFAVKNK